MSEDNYFGMMEEIIKYKDAPLGVSNEIPLAQMPKELKKDIAVVFRVKAQMSCWGGYGRIFRLPFDYSNIDSGVEEDFYSYFIKKYEYVPREIRDKYLCCDTHLRNVYDDAIKNEFSRHCNDM